ETTPGTFTLASDWETLPPPEGRVTLGVGGRFTVTRPRFTVADTPLAPPSTLSIGSADAAGATAIPQVENAAAATTAVPKRIPRIPTPLTDLLGRSQALQANRCPDQLITSSEYSRLSSSYRLMNGLGRVR